MSGGKVAIRYARALFELAKPQNEIDSYGKILEQVASQIAENSELREFIITPHVPHQAKKEVLDQVFTGMPEMMKNFLHLLVDKGREGIIEEISVSYRSIVDEDSKALEVTVTSIKELSSEEEAALVRRLEESSGRSVRLILEKDPSLLGGLVIRIGNRLIDGSIKSRIQAMGRALATPTQKQAEVEG